MDWLVICSGLACHFAHLTNGHSPVLRFISPNKLSSRHTPVISGRSHYFLVEFCLGVHHALTTGSNLDSWSLLKNNVLSRTLNPPIGNGVFCKHKERTHAAVCIVVYHSNSIATACRHGRSYRSFLRALLFLGVIYLP